MLAVAFGMLLGVRPELLALALGVASGGGVLVLTARLGARDHGWRDPLVWLAPAALALHGSFLSWSTGGLETQLFSLLVLGGFSACLDERLRDVERPWRAPVWFALATLTRPDGVLFAVVAGSAWLLDSLRRRRSLRPAAVWAAVYAVPVLAHAVWRRAYYGDWLPNTFHAKVTGFRWEEGLRYIASFLTSYQLHLLLALALLAVLARRGFREVLLAAAVAADLLYLAAIGGDFLEYRFMVPLLPYLYWLIADGVRVIREWSVRTRRRWGPAAAPLAAAALLAGTAVSPLAWIEPPWFFESVEHIHRYALRRANQGRYLAGLVERGVLPADLRIATGGIGALPYYTDWFVIDHHGLTDRSVASSPATEARLGHGHRVTVEYLAEREVAAVLLAHVLVVPEAAPLPAILDGAREWLQVYNRGVEEPDLLLRLICVEVEPGIHLFFGTNLDPEEERRLVGRFPSCPVKAPPQPGPTPPAAAGSSGRRSDPGGTPPPSAEAPRR